jgi:hypothetical protein
MSTRYKLSRNMVEGLLSVKDHGVISASFATRRALLKRGLITITYSPAALRRLVRLTAEGAAIVRATGQEPE